MSRQKTATSKKKKHFNKEKHNGLAYFIFSRMKLTERYFCKKSNEIKYQQEMLPTHFFDDKTSFGRKKKTIDRKRFLV